MCPLQVHSWKNIGEDKLEHMWRAVTYKFDSDDMNHQRDHVLNHMKKLWTNWRGSLHRYVKFKPLHEALKDVPKEVDKSGLEWLVKEHFLSEKFKGCKDGNLPNMATIFFETHKKEDTLVEPEASKIYTEIQEVVQFEPSLTNIEVIERCFGPQNKSHVVGLGGGITTKELKGGSFSKAAILVELNATRKEKESLQTELNATKNAKESLEKYMDDFESKYDHLISLLFFKSTKYKLKYLIGAQAFYQFLHDEYP
ncbi:uncharacterized protein LOC107827318 [Nicotiana tabacum]|uniref:uncharacterized protein LOC107827318 n=1 Tax=Nicotiana tabacum TaxID=4097 RepID=UPI003F4E7D4C